MKRGALFVAVAVAAGGVVSMLLHAPRSTRSAADEREPPAVSPIRVPTAPPAAAPQAAPARPAAGNEGIGRLPGAEENEWVSLNNTAAGHLDAGETEEACEGFRRCHEARPENDVFRRNLAEALARLAREEYEAGRLAAAIAAAEEVLELAPERADAESLRERLRRWRAQSDVEGDDWSEGSDLFTLSFDTDRRDILHNSQDVLDHLEKCYEELRLYFAADPVREMGRRPIRVVLYDASEFDRVTGLGDWAGGVFDGTVRVSVDDLRAGNWRPTLKHELVHVFLHELGGRAVPGWLNEGLAQLLEERPADVEAARRRLREAGSLFSLEELAGSLVAWTDKDAIARAYAQTLAWAEVIRRHWGDEALRRMVRAAGEGGEVGAAFQAWSGVPLPFAFTTFVEELRR